MQLGPRHISNRWSSKAAQARACAESGEVPPRHSYLLILRARSRQGLAPCPRL